MIPIPKANKPTSFDRKVYEPGMRAIAELAGKNSPFPRTAGKPHTQIVRRKLDIPAKKFPPYWTEILDELMLAYESVCAYSCFRIHPVTGARSVDHFAAKSWHWRNVYKWTNYRLCCSRLNSRKNDFPDVLDPFEIKQDWFQLELLGYQVIPGLTQPAQLHQEILDTIERLGLNEFARERAEDAQKYLDGDCSLKTLKKESPFVAYELYRQGKLRNGDVW